MLSQALKSTLEDPGCCAPPAAMQEPDRPPDWIDEIDGNAVGDRHGEQQARRPGGMPIDPFNLEPAANALMPGHRVLVDLIAEDNPAEPGLRASEGAPARHDLARGGLGPQPEVETPTRQVAPAGDAGHHPESLPPAGNLEPGHRARQQRLADSRAVPGSEFRVVHRRVPRAEPAVSDASPLATWYSVLVTRDSYSSRSIFAPSARSRASICS